MVDFKVGDRVVGTGIVDCEDLEGFTGTVVAINGLTGPLLVSFDDWHDGHGFEGSEWYCNRNDVKPYVKPTRRYDFKVGDKVRYTGGANYGRLEPGWEGVVDKVNAERIRVDFQGNGTWYFWEPGCGPMEDEGNLELVTEAEAVEDDNELYAFLQSLAVVFKEAFTVVPSPKVITPRISSLEGVTPGAITILKHLKARGSISPVEAFSSYGTLRLAPRIHELRKAGYEINTEMRKDHAGHAYARYSFVQA